MENLKIRVTTKQESKEAQELFFELGCYWAGGKAGGKNEDNVIKVADGRYIFSRLGEMTHCDSSEVELNGVGSSLKEITLPQLRDMVVLKRNDLKDATHKCLWDVNPEYYTDSKGSVYFYKKELDASCWVKTVNSKDWCDKNLKLIKDEAMKESLNDKIATAEVARQELKGVDATLAERQSQYGSFEDVAFVTESIMATMARVRPNELNDLPHPHRMALYMIASKMARIVNGDFNSIDGWHDIAGYATLIERIIGDSNVREKMD